MTTSNCVQCGVFYCWGRNLENASLCPKCSDGTVEEKELRHKIRVNGFEKGVEHGKRIKTIEDGDK